MLALIMPWFNCHEQTSAWQIKLWAEVDLYERILHKNRFQHRSTIYFRRLCEVLALAFDSHATIGTGARL
jgi:hypothetical protein